MVDSMAEGRRKKEEGRRQKAEGRRQKAEGKIWRCLSFQLLICSHLSFDYYN
ncbi:MULTISPECIES: hypothetical protein [Okeania]|uniref:hypothetical protein n=1 Tax=Okeania TaxID=1458928 RepID=UPI001864C30E|nr:MULTISPECIES: hypothetical protein [Okeania]